MKTPINFLVASLFLFACSVFSGGVSSTENPRRIHPHDSVCAASAGSVEIVFHHAGAGGKGSKKKYETVWMQARNDIESLRIKIEKFRPSFIRCATFVAAQRRNVAHLLCDEKSIGLLAEYEQKIVDMRHNYYIFCELYNNSIQIAKRLRMGVSVRVLACPLKFHEMLPQNLSLAFLSHPKCSFCSHVKQNKIFEPRCNCGKSLISPPKDEYEDARFLLARLREGLNSAHKIYALTIEILNSFPRLDR